MNSVEKELHGYINGTENMSGFDSYDSFEGDMSYFDDDDMSYFDDDDERNSIFHFFCVCLLSEGDTILTGVAVPWRLLTRTVMSFSFFEIRAPRARRACIILSVRAIIIYFFSE